MISAALSAALILPTVAMGRTPPFTGKLAKTYRDEYAYCRFLGAKTVRSGWALPKGSQLAIAHAYAWKVYAPAFRQAAFEGCWDGFRHAKPQLPHSWS